MLISSLSFVTNVSPNPLAEWELWESWGTSLSVGTAAPRLAAESSSWDLLHRHPEHSCGSLLGWIPCSLGSRDPTQDLLSCLFFFPGLLLPFNGTYFPKASGEAVLGGDLFWDLVFWKYLYSVFTLFVPRMLRAPLHCPLVASGVALRKLRPLWLLICCGWDLLKNSRFKVSQWCALRWVFHCSVS